jgi:hypothetical protein
LWSQSEWIEVTAAQYGIHAARPNPSTIVAGSLYVESDRGGVIYQVQAEVWKYLAGTMYGTLSPDQRPTDLGVNDGGFTFRGTDQQREYIWSQTVWVETTISVQWAAGSGLTITTTYQDIPGATLTLPRAGTYLVHGVFDFSMQSVDTGNIALGQLAVGGTAASPYVAIFAGLTTPTGASVRATVAQQWIYVAASTGVVLKLQASKTSAGGIVQAAGHSTISATWISS